MCRLGAPAPIPYPLHLVASDPYYRRRPYRAGEGADSRRGRAAGDGHHVSLCFCVYSASLHGCELTARADCDDCSFATISSLEVDGNRPQLLRIKKGDALIEIGNAEGQVVRDCRLYEPR